MQMINARKGTAPRLARMFRGCTCALALLTGLGAAQSIAQEAGPQLNWGVEMEIGSLDPVYQTNNWEYMTVANVYDSLVWPDREQGVKPWVAESWTISDDARTYTFKIKTGVPFHDGTEITAEDVAFSFKRMMDLAGPAASNFRSLTSQGVSVVDDNTVAVTLTEPDSAFLKALLTFKIVNKDLVMANLGTGTYGEFGDYGVEYLRTHDAGSGPYQATDIRLSDYVQLERFADYPFTTWTEQTPASVRISTVPEMATIATMLRAGEIDVASWSLPITMQNQIAQDTRFVMQKDLLPTAWFVIMNNSKPPLDDLAVRKAVAMAYDSNTVTQYILGGGGPLAGPVPASMLGACDGIPTYQFDIEAAKAELAKSKYSAEELASFSMDIAAVAGSERFKNIALLLSTNLAKIGLKAEVQSVRWTDIGQAQTTPETAYDFVVFYDGAKVPDPNVFLTYYTPKGFGDAFPPGGMYYENPEVTKLIETGIQSTDVAVQQSSYCDAVKLIAADSPAIFSHTDERQVSRWAYVNGFGDNEGALFFDLRFENWTLDTESPDYKANHQ